MAISVFNADDHPMLKKGITDLIVDTPGLEWVGSAENGQEALDKIRSIKPDIAILDIEMPHLSGLDAARQLISEGVRTQFILLTLFKDPSFFNEAIKAGIKGYLLKESKENEILDCIHQVHSGRAYINPQLSHLLIDKNAQQSKIFTVLSEHEINILKLIAMQKTSAEIADMLFISPKTVANHRSNISKKLQLSGEQNGLLKWAIENKALLNS